MMVDFSGDCSDQAKSSENSPQWTIVNLVSKTSLS